MISDDKDKTIYIYFKFERKRFDFSIFTNLNSNYMYNTEWIQKYRNTD